MRLRTAPLPEQPGTCVCRQSRRRDAQHRVRSFSGSNASSLRRGPLSAGHVEVGVEKKRGQGQRIQVPRRRPLVRKIAFTIGIDKFAQGRIGERTRFELREVVRRHERARLEICTGRQQDHAH